eukprot:1326191-Amphidinium_carterae.3
MGNEDEPACQDLESRAVAVATQQHERSGCELLKWRISGSHLPELICSAPWQRMFLPHWLAIFCTTSACLAHQGESMRCSAQAALGAMVLNTLHDQDNH